MNHILIVEDEDFLVRALKDNLESEGLSVSSTAEGESALTEIKRKRPDLVLLDLLMPKRDGFYVLEEMKKNIDWKLIPIIVVSNLGGEDDIKKALEMGADDYFIKSQHPIEEVIERVKEYLSGARSVKPNKKD